MRGILYGVVALVLCATAPALGEDAAESGRINRGAAEAQMPPQNSPAVDVKPVAPGVPDDQPKPPATAQSPGADANTGFAPQGPIGATRQTMPAKFSAENETMDERPIMAHPIGLTDDQKRRIYEAVAERDDGIVRALEAGPATILPADVVLQELPDAIVSEIPAVKHYKYVRLPEKVLLVAPANRIVVGEIVR